MAERARKVAAPKFGEKIPESDKVSIFREFYKDAAEKDTHLSEQER